MNARWSSVGMAVVSIVVLCLLLSLSTLAQSDAPEVVESGTLMQLDAVTGRMASDAEQTAALRYWTRDRLAATQPLAIAVDAGPSDVVTAELGRMAVNEPPGFAAGGLPEPDADRIARRHYPAEWSAREERNTGEAVAAAEMGPLAPDGTSQVYTSYIVNQSAPLWKQYPYRTIGRLSFLTANGTNFCSATSISGNNVIVTAAHCVYNSTANVWYSNFVFTPAFRGTSGPYGNFPAQSCWILNSYINLTGNYAVNTWGPHDVAVCKMNNNSAGKSLSAAVGWLGRTWNNPYNVHVHNNGYPFFDFNNNSLPNAGKYLHTCIGETFQQAAELLGVGCNRGPGISGGPWVVGLAPFVATGWVNSVNSGLFFGTQNLYGARFNSNNIVPLCNIAQVSC